MTEPSCTPYKKASAPVKVEVLRVRADFLAVAATGHKWVAPGVVIQIGPHDEKGHPHAPYVRYGLTASKKVGNAVVRNRARRRLRALARELLPQHGRAGFDYVLIARPSTANQSFAELRRDCLTALKKLGNRF